MPQAQQYRLRLTEGTLLVVDHDALSSWLSDEKALVQPMGSQRWRLLRQFLADERAGIGAASAAAPPERPRVPQGETAHGRDVTWARTVAPVRAAGVPAPPPTRPCLHREDEEEVFAPVLGEASPWDWTLDHATTIAAGAAPAAEAPREPEPEDFQFPNDEIMTLDDLVAPKEHATTTDVLSAVLDEAPAPPIDFGPRAAARAKVQVLAPVPGPCKTLREAECIQVLADGVATASAPVSEDLRVIPLKALDEAPAGPPPAAAALDPAFEPLEAVVWGSGPLARFCCAVAGWSKTIDRWIHRGKKAADRGDEYTVALLTGAQQAGPRVTARLRDVPSDTRTLLTAWRELVEGWAVSLRVWWSKGGAPRR